jgi:predicted PurR-regulated permease PerM
MDEISKIGDVNSVNDILEFKLSVKTILILLFLWIVICIVGFIIFMGGINNAIAYLTNIMNSTKKTIIEIKTNNINKRGLNNKKEEEDNIDED